MTLPPQPQLPAPTWPRTGGAARPARARLVCLLLLLAAPAAALDAHKTAASLGARAAKAFESGDMTAAATLYREAFHIDPAEPNYLYGAARAAHTGRDLAHAEEDYVAFLALPDIEAARAQKARAYLEALRKDLSDQKSKEAQQAADAGDALLAATLYLEAWRMAPDRPEPLLKAAMLERKRGDKKSAVTHLQRYLQLAPRDATGRATAEALLRDAGAALVPTAAERAAEEKAKAEEAAQKRAAAERAAADRLAAQKAAADRLAAEEAARRAAAERAAAERVAKRAAADRAAAEEKAAASARQSAESRGPGTSGRRVAAWAGVGIGGGAIVTAAILAFAASGQQTSLDQNRFPDGMFDDTRITVERAASEQTSINGKWTGAAVLAGVGVAGLGLGIWLLATDSGAVALVPIPGGGAVAGRW